MSHTERQFSPRFDGPDQIAPIALSVEHLASSLSTATHGKQDYRGPGRMYVFVVISLACFLVGLTFWSRPELRVQVAGELALKAVPVPPPALASKSEMIARNRSADEHLQRLMGNAEVW